MIITSVVPPELPMELSLAVTNSLLSLTKLSIFCTEPFRIPFAGKVDVVCFDKTGTLTSDALEMHGVAGLQSTSLVALEDPQQLVAPAALPTSIQLILAGCHSLVLAVVLGSSTESDSLGVKLLSKGAPEVMESLFASIPDYYTRVYKHYALKGCRVLALGSKTLSTRDLQRLKTIARSEMEKNLEFGGFLVLDCPVKHDTTDVIQELKTSKHVLVMITGDNALTALDVAKQTMASLAASTNLCATGDALTLLTPAQLQLVVRHACVFARTSPSQKEAILDALNQSVVDFQHVVVWLRRRSRCGFVTAMCGDGTNDVGALKRAHVGISIINNPDQPTTTPTEPSSSHVVKFGDASIASPFTSKQPSIRATCQILCQGRCTLVTTLQMYKILGINCLLSAYVLSSLYMYGVKQGDMQMTVVGVVIALFYLFLSYAKPCTRLSARRPLTRVFCLSVLLSMGIQFVVHLATLAAALDVALPFVDMDDPAMHPEAKFRPNVLNSIVFVVSLHMQINTFVVNYHVRR
ncbi:hypothetical protein DYB32_002772 [Aphanomyces invadans]|uniref:Cation-transporting P-type ATPase C-terminal domain-containing protein n=1 Tax=Aphanomyces invadans TaxID=157072 RepID=A0A3R6VPZ4_9STRA|nr:hypothetical protein DYB32_002772 [Aphanomyces invadans]